MTTNREIYSMFENIGDCIASTVDENGMPASRVAGFFAGDEDGFYLRTMKVKPFYRQMMAAGSVSICGLKTPEKVRRDENNLPVFEPGIMLRVTGKVREMSVEEVKAKAEHDSNFDVAVFDINKYPMTVVLHMYEGWGEIYDYDFGMKTRDHKLERERFAFGGAHVVQPGLLIGDKCIGCGTCMSACTFKAIEPGNPGEPYRILGNRCDECGNCYNVCPAGAVSWREH